MDLPEGEQLIQIGFLLAALVLAVRGFQATRRRRDD